MLHPNDDHDYKSLTGSRLRWYSRGIAAANKALSSFNLEVTPIEELNEFDGEVSDQYANIKTTATNAAGRVSSANIKVSNTITATWLPIGGSNRKTAPDIRRGERLMIYQLGDSDRYFWTTLYQDDHLRRLETVIYGWSATSQEDATLGANNMYWFELSTHNGVVGFYTSKANGEPFAYTLQLNTKEGYLTIKDDADNFIHLNSAEQRIEFGNSAKSLFDMVGENITIESVNSISQNTKNYSLQCTNYNVTASTATHTGATFNINSVTTISKALTAAANFSASAGTACSLPGGTTVGGELLVQSARASGNIYASNFIET